MHKSLLLLTLVLSSWISAQTTFSPKVTINANTGASPYSAQSGLIDADGFKDILISTFNGNTIEWYKGNGDGTFTLQPLVSNSLSGIIQTKLVDLNGDGFLDIIGTGFNNNRVLWIENDGSGNFISQYIISNSISGASGITLGDINNDTFIDVAITATNGNEVVWFANDGIGNFTLQTSVIDNTLIAPGSVELNDIDNDGDLDAILGTAAYVGGPDVIEIFRNNLIGSGTVSFTKDANSVATGKYGIFNTSVEDIDGDSNLDILVTEVSFGSGPNGNLYWYEDNGSGFTETVISTSINNPSIATFVDLDVDGLKDILLSSGTNGAGNDLVWFKNNGDGSFGPEQVVDDTQSQAFVYVLDDFDDDGDIDIASCAYNENDLNYFENEKFLLSLNASDRNNFSFYPNPVIDRLHFRGITEPLQVELINTLAQLVLSSEVSPHQSLDLASVPSGLYTLVVNGSNSYKIIKR